MPVANESIGNPSFSCGRLWMGSPQSGSFDWFGYEVSQDGVTSGTYSYRDSFGQSVTQPFSVSALGKPRLTIMIPDLPRIKVLKETVRFSDNTFSGEAVFTELESVKGMDLDRNFNVALAWTPRWTRLEVSRKEFGFIKGNRIRFSYKVVNLYGSTPKLTVIGDGFATASNFVTVKTQR